MVEILIGAGGWDYFNIPGDRLRNYARAFKTVEVNSTYYSIPPLALVESWRRRVPEDFEFTLRCNRELIRTLQFEHLDSALEFFECMKKICYVLKAKILHVLTSPALKLGKEMIEKTDAFLSSADLSNVQLAWEIRGGYRNERQNLLGVLKNHKVIHCVDLSRENPAYESGIIYSRLFGKGAHNIYQFTNFELEDIDEKIKGNKAEKLYLNFHGAKMYKDAARMSIYKATGKFPKVTNSLGVSSVLEVLKEDAQFPLTTSALIKFQGWKVCEWEEGKQLHVSEILSRIEEKRFDNLSELEEEFRKLKL